MLRQGNPATMGVRKPNIFGRNTVRRFWDWRGKKEAAVRADFAALVDEVYRAVLLRPVDAEALAQWEGRLAQSPHLIGDFLRGLLSSDEFAGQVRRFLNAHVDPEKLRFVHDNSQNGEISLLLRALVDRGAEPYVVDVGAYGRSGSNSYDLMRYFGWSGLLIEANSQLHEKINAEFKGLDYTLAGVAAALEDGKATLYLGVHDEISSIYRGNTAMWGDVEGSIDVRAAKLSTILSEHNVPQKIGLMSIDCECDGFDLLEDALEHGYVPQWVIIEVFEGLKVETLDKIAKSDATKEAYRIVGRTFPNLLLERVKD